MLGSLVKREDSSMGVLRDWRAAEGTPESRDASGGSEVVDGYS
jgi:hypothetical protein